MHLHNHNMTRPMDLPLTYARDAAISHHAHQPSCLNMDPKLHISAKFQMLLRPHTYLFCSAPSHDTSKLGAVVPSMLNKTLLCHMRLMNLMSWVLPLRLQGELLYMYHKDFLFQIATKRYSSPLLQMLPQLLLKWVTRW